VPELIAYLKQDSAHHTFSSGGFGTPAHLIGELFKLETGVQATTSLTHSFRRQSRTARGPSIPTSSSPFYR
jgi:tripartite-type tricarboxylate transporter receptor subunit TctC